MHFALLNKAMAAEVSDTTGDAIKNKSPYNNCIKTAAGMRCLRLRYFVPVYCLYAAS